MLAWKFCCLLLIFLQANLIVVRCESSTHGNADEHAEAEEGDKVVHWGYHGHHSPEHWNEVNPLCSKRSPRQSPVDIYTEPSVFDDNLEAIHLNEKLEKPISTMKIVNNGHSVNVEVPHPVFITGGGLPEDSKYQIAGFHFHWGKTDSVGSEHTVHGKSFPLEMHMVSYDTARHDALGDAVFGDNSLAVLGTIFQISRQNNTLLDPIIEGLKSVQTPNSEATIKQFNIGRLLPAHTNKFFRYLGSLTTPPCAESVIWTLFLHTQPISHAQLKEFRTLIESTDEANGITYHITQNYRPTQPLHGRAVHRSFLLESELKAESASHSGSGGVGPALGLLAVCSIVIRTLS